MRVCAVGGHLYVPLNYVPWGNLCTTTIAYVSQLVLGGIAPVSLYALKIEGHLQLEQPLFLRMSSGVVPKTNLTFCSTPCRQRTHIICRRLVGEGVSGWGRLFMLGKAHNRCSRSFKELPFKITMSK